jgi:hypothetical protein
MGEIPGSATGHGIPVRAVVMAIGLLYMLALWSMCMLYEALDPLVS